MTGSYCRRAGIVPRADASNRRLRYRRNLIRHEILPQLEAMINPAVRDAMLNLAETARLENDYLSGEAERLMRRLVSRSEGNRLYLPADGLDSLHPALRARVVHLMLSSVAGRSEDITHHDVATILERIGDPNRRQWSLLCGVTVTTQSGLVVEPTTYPCSPIPFSVALPLPGTVELEARGLRLSVTETRISAMPDRIAEDELLLPVGAVDPPLVVRTVRDGDRIQPMGMVTVKKVRDHLRDARLPARTRRGFLLVADQTGVLWLPGVAADERVRITGTPCEIYRIRMMTIGRPTT
jgi:tRNA(Ile)-lysidine synthase